MSEKTTYRFWRHHKTEGSKIFEIAHKDDLLEWERANSGWYTHKNLIPQDIKDIKVEEVEITEEDIKEDEVKETEE
jgi:hypothetical protein